MTEYGETTTETELPFRVRQVLADLFNLPIGAVHPENTLLELSLMRPTELPRLKLGRLNFMHFMNLKTGIKDLGFEFTRHEFPTPTLEFWPGTHIDSKGQITQTGFDILTRSSLLKSKTVARVGLPQWEWWNGVTVQHIISMVLEKQKRNQHHKEAQV